MPSFNFAAWLREPASKVAIVGAGGWIGRAAAEAVLAQAPDLAPGRLRLFASRAREESIRGRPMQVEALNTTSRLDDGDWIVVHAGVIGGDATPGGEARRRNDALLDAVLDLSGTASVRRLILASSGAAGRVDAAASPARAAYAAMKRDHEAAAQTWRRRTGTRLLVPRVFNLGGPYMTLPHTYALGDFILGLKANGRIDIGAADPVFRSYVHVREMVEVLFEMAIDDDEDEAPFDVGGAQVVELGALARRVAGALAMPGADIRRPAPAGGAGDWYVGDGRRYQTALFRTGHEPRSLDAIIRDTIAYLDDAPSSADGRSRM